MRRMSWKVLAIIAIAIWLSPIFIASWLNRPYPSKPLSLKLVTWKEIGIVKGCTDFDGDGNDELVVRDNQGQWWAVWWDEGKCKRGKLPVSKGSWILSSQRGVFEDAQKLIKVRFVDGKWQVKVVPEEVADRDASLGWQRQEKWGYVALADVDGDKRLDRISWDGGKRLMVKTAKSEEWKKQKLSYDLWAVKDLDGDGKVELVNEEFVDNVNRRVVCWYFDTEAGKWRSGSVQMPFVRLGDLEGFPCEFFMESVFGIKQESGFALIGLTNQKRRTQIWKLVWQGDRWRKELFDEFEGEGLPTFTGQDWLVLPFLKPPRWWLWIREKVDELMERLNFKGLPPIDLKIRLIGRTGKGKWVTLMRFKYSELIGIDLADLDSDGLLEIALILSQLDDSSVYVGKFVSGQWWLGREKLPNKFVPYDLLGKNFRYRGINWALWQDENNRCVAVTVKR
ncbi:MAG: hypothetical protein NZ937_02030 [Armatimonadetes bacterium]|nr:hypothetical protein [Armatimonadota bacterium]